MGDWRQTAVNHSTKEEIGNKPPLYFYNNITAGPLDKDGVLSLDEAICGFFKSLIVQLSVAFQHLLR